MLHSLMLRVIRFLKAGTHTILYTITNPKSLTGSATRTVIVSAPKDSLGAECK
jgi:hypothetical protein